jgi:hypothetical protein
MYIRFITEFKNEFDEIETGVFHAAAYLRRSHIIYDYDKKHLTEIRDWFNSNLDAPNRFSKAKRKNAADVSLSWFKASAIDHLKKMYELKEIIEKYDLFITVLKRENPGYIVYQDEFQVSTVPHKKDKSLAK